MGDAPGVPPTPRPRGQPFPSDAPHGLPYLQPEEEGPLPTPRPAPPAQRPHRRPQGPARCRAARVPYTPDRARLPASSAAAAQSRSPPPLAARSARPSRRAGAAGQPHRWGPRREMSVAMETGRAQAAVKPRRHSQVQFGGPGPRPSAPNSTDANPSRARDASARPPPSASRLLQRGRRPTASSESAGRLARARGGASGRPGLWETSASGAAAIATLGSTGQ